LTSAITVDTADKDSGKIAVGKVDTGLSDKVDTGMNSETTTADKDLGKTTEGKEDTVMSDKKDKEDKDSGKTTADKVDAVMSDKVDTGTDSATATGRAALEGAKTGVATIQVSEKAPKTIASR
jgi:hypothetical protein